MRALITGGAGFIGSHTLDLLLQHGARVTVLDDFSSGKWDNLPDHSALRIVRGDVRDPVAVASAMTGNTHVLHLAAQVSVTASVEDPPASQSRNIGGFVTVLDCARRQNVQRFIYASSAAVFDAHAPLPLDESSAVAPLSPYGLEKSINDQYAALYQKLYGLPCLGLRYFNAYGPRQDPRSPYAGVISIFASLARQGRALTVHGNGQQSRDFIFVADVARANVAALQSGYCGVCNVATGRSVTLFDLIDALGRCLDREPVVKLGPVRAGDIPHSASRNERLKRELGIASFTSLEDGLRLLLKSEESAAGIRQQRAEECV